MMKKLRLGVLHYHLKQGGVRTVVREALRSLIAFGGYEAITIDLITSDAKGESGAELVGELNGWACEYGVDSFCVNQVELAMLGYDESPAASRGELFEKGGIVRDALLDVMARNGWDEEVPYVLHVHNANLGKNPYLTLGLRLLADVMDEGNLPGWILYQVHDFAEDNRPDCWRALRDCSGEADVELARWMMYPASRRVQWVCINSADKAMLEAIGLPAEQVSVLPNCVEIEAFESKGLGAMTSEELQELGLDDGGDYRMALKGRIGEYAKAEGYCFDAEREIILSPVKTIRRKNIIESVLLVMAMNRKAGKDAFELVVTLPGYTGGDVAYCEALAGFVKEKQLPVVIGVGESLLRGGQQREIVDGEVVRYALLDLLDAARAVVTTSVQEGFGYVFHEGWLAGKLVLGRNIKRVTDDFKASGMVLDHLYDEVLVPFEWVADQWNAICDGYLEKVKQVSQAVGREVGDDAELREAIEKEKIVPFGGRMMIDWGDLDVAGQLAVLEAACDEPERLDDLVLASGELKAIEEWFPEEEGTIIKTNGNIVREHYNMKHQAELLRACFDRGQQWLGKESIHIDYQGILIDNTAVFDRSVELAGMRLLL